jgi:hypothetical protein
MKGDRNITSRSSITSSVKPSSERSHQTDPDKQVKDSTIFPPPAMTKVRLACQASALRKSDTMEQTASFGDDLIVLPPPPTAPCSRGISWGGKAHSISMLLLGKSGAGNTNNGASKISTSDNDIHIFMDSSDREELCHSSHPSFADLFTSGVNVVRLIHERTHPSHAASDNLLSSSVPPPPTMVSSPSIQILHTGSGDTRIINELLWEESFNGSATHVGVARDDPLSCCRFGHKPRWASLMGDDPVVVSLSDRMTPSHRETSQSNSLARCCPVSSRSDDEDNSGRGMEGMRANDASAQHRNCRDAPPRMPSRRELSDDFQE